MNEREMWSLMVGERIVYSSKQYGGTVVERTHNAVLVRWDDGIETSWSWIDMQDGEGISKQTEGSKRK